MAPSRDPRAVHKQKQRPRVGSGESQVSSCGSEWARSRCPHWPPRQTHLYSAAPAHFPGSQIPPLHLPAPSSSPASSRALLPPLLPRPGASGRPGCANPRRVPPPDAELGPARPRPLTSGICMSSRAAAARAQLSERARAESRRVQAAAAARLLRGEWRRRGPGAWQGPRAGPHRSAGGSQLCLQPHRSLAPLRARVRPWSCQLLASTSSRWKASRRSGSAR